MQRFTHWPKAALAGLAGVLAALGVATALTQASATTTTTTTTPTSTTSTTKTTATTTTPKATSKPQATTRTITCREALIATKPPIESAENYGTVSCAAPLGKGVHHDTSTITRSSQTAGSFAGPLQLFFNTGTLRGTYKMGFTVVNKVITYDGTLKISSGTGAFSGVTGTGTITGTSNDAVKSAITEKLTLRFPPKKAT